MVAIRIAVIAMCLISLAVTVVMARKNNRHQEEAALVTMIFAVLNLVLMALDEIF